MSFYFLKTAKEIIFQFTLCDFSLSEDSIYSTLLVGSSFELYWIDQEAGVSLFLKEEGDDAPMTLFKFPNGIAKRNNISFKINSYGISISVKNDLFIYE